MKEDSGRLAFVDDFLSYESATHGSWRLDASSIRLIGEFTNQSGPAMDDYFLVFLRSGENGWYDASFYCEGREDVWKARDRTFSWFSAARPLQFRGFQKPCTLAHNARRHTFV
jgi:hypothetical protein